MIRYVVATAITLAALTALRGVPHSTAPVKVPEPAVDEPMATHAGQEKAVLENCGYRQLNSWWATMGSFQAMTGRSGWGTMKRRRFERADV